jgi:hypothetical protein
MRVFCWSLVSIWDIARTHAHSTPATQAQTKSRYNPWLNDETVFVFFASIKKLKKKKIAKIKKVTPARESNPGHWKLRCVWVTHITWAETIMLVCGSAHARSKITSKNSQNAVQKHLSNKMKILSSLKTHIYPKWFPNASTVTWSLVLQTIKLSNKTEQFWKCDEFSGEIQLTDI